MSSPSPIQSRHERVAAQQAELLENLKARRDEIDEAFERHGTGWAYEDGIYRFYHQSFKVFGLQAHTSALVDLLASLAPAGCSLNEWFTEIVAGGTGHEFHREDNERWTTVTRPIVEAYLHVRALVDMARRCAHELETPPQVLPPSWATVLYIYGLR